MYRLVRKILCASMAAFMLIASLTHANAESTEKRNIFDFLQRLSEYLDQTEAVLGTDASFSEVERDMSCLIASEFVDPLDGTSCYAISLPIGIVTVSVPSFEIESIFMGINYEDKRMTSSVVLLCRAIALMAVLEYDRTDDRLYEAMHTLDNTRPSSVLLSTMYCFDDYGKKVGQLYANSNDKDVVLHEGNYTYSLSIVSSDIGDTIYLTAEAK